MRKTGEFLDVGEAFVIARGPVPETTRHLPHDQDEGHPMTG